MRMATQRLYQATNPQHKQIFAAPSISLLRANGRNGRGERAIGGAGIERGGERHGDDPRNSGTIAHA